MTTDVDACKFWPCSDTEPIQANCTGHKLIDWLASCMVDSEYVGIVACTWLHAVMHDVILITKYIGVCVNQVLLAIQSLPCNGTCCPTCIPVNASQ
jgi:hypothetical protein